MHVSQVSITFDLYDVVRCVSSYMPASSYVVLVLVLVLEIVSNRHFAGAMCSR